jgi:hypothetical protein
VPTNLPAGWAYGFVRGVAPLGGPLTLVVLATGERLPLADALDQEPFGTLPAPYLRSAGNRDEVTVRFRPGTARFRLAPGFFGPPPCADVGRSADSATDETPPPRRR